MKEWAIRADRNYRIFPRDPLYQPAGSFRVHSESGRLKPEEEADIAYKPDAREMVLLGVTLESRGQRTKLVKRFPDSQDPTITLTNPFTGKPIEAEVAAVRPVDNRDIELVVLMSRNSALVLRGEIPESDWTVSILYPWSTRESSGRLPEELPAGGELNPQTWVVYSHSDQVASV